MYEAAREARAKNYTHLYVIGFAIQPNARELIEKCDSVVNIPATYVQATPDLIMSDLLKNTRSSQVFSVCGMPEAELRKGETEGERYDPTKYEVELLGMDVFDPDKARVNHRKGDDVPAWFLDADYNGLCFHVITGILSRALEHGRTLRRHFAVITRKQFGITWRVRLVLPLRLVKLGRLRQGD